MTAQIIQYEGGDVLAAEEPLTITGLLLPYNEVGRTNLGRFQVEAGSVEIPADPTGLGTNRDHVRHDVVGGIVRLEDRPTAKVPGVYASIKFADTPDGRAAYQDATSGQRRKLSAEFGPAVIKAGKLVAGHAKLWGSAIVNAGAFPSAQVLAADTPDDETEQEEEQPMDENDTPDEPTETTETFTEEFVDEDGVTRKRTTTRTTRVEPDGDGGTKTTITEQTVIEEPDTEPEEEEEEPAVSVPNTLAAKRGTAKTQPREVDLSQVYAAISSYKANPHDATASQVLAAIADIKISGTGSLPASGVLRENWVGPVWQGKTYERQYIHLAKLGTDITAAGKRGFKINRGTAAAPVDQLGGDWAGNKVGVPTGQGHTSTLGSTLARFAFAADIAREFFDLPGGQEVVEAFIRLIVEDYATWSDEKALTTFVTTAGTPVAPNTYPTQYSGSLGQLIQGILAVRRAKDTPSFAIANQTAYEQLLYTPKDLVPEFISFDFNTEGTGSADSSKVTVVEAPDSAFTGIEADTPAVLVGSKNGIEFDELGSTPIQIDALEIARGGIDRALHGYLQTFVVRPESYVLIGTAAA